MRDRLYEIERLLDEIRAEEINSYVEQCIDDIYDEVNSLKSKVNDIETSNNMLEAIISEFGNNEYTMKLYDDVMYETDNINEIVK